MSLLLFPCSALTHWCPDPQSGHWGSHPRFNLWHCWMGQRMFPGEPFSQDAVEGALAKSVSAAVFLSLQEGVKSRKTYVHEGETVSCPCLCKRFLLSYLLWKELGLKSGPGIWSRLHWCEAPQADKVCCRFVLNNCASVFDGNFSSHISQASKA